MSDVTLPLLSSGAAVATADLFLTRQGADTVDKKVTGTQLKTFINAATNDVFGETPSGTINGINVTFTLASTPTANTERIFINGMRQKLTGDYTIVTSTITFVSAPVVGDVLLSDYQY